MVNKNRLEIQKFKHEQTNSDLMTYMYILLLHVYNKCMKQPRLVKEKFKHEETQSDLMTFKCLLTSTDKLRNTHIK